MANCPNCGSNDIQLKRETNVSWGRAVVGYVLLGVVGGAVGAVTGEDRNVNACLDCGTSWKASDLYNSLQLIQQRTGQKLDLTLENHRLFLDKAILEISSYSKKIEAIDNSIEQQIKEKKEGSFGQARGILLGAITGTIIAIIMIVICIILSFKYSSTAYFMIFILIVFSFGLFGAVIGQQIEPKDDKTLNKIRILGENQKKNEEQEFKVKFMQIKSRYLK